MQGLLAAMVAVEDVDPTKVQPSPMTTVVFGFLLLATVLLLWSFVRHLRRAQTNLGSSRTEEGAGYEPWGSSNKGDRVEGESP